MKLKRLVERSAPYLLILLAAIVMMWPQIHSRAFFSGYDYYFHMSRTYETAMQIKTGHFSYFLSIFSWNHNARIVNALYGPVGGYLSGLLLLMTRSWLRWEICISLIALVTAGSTMYCLGRYWHLNKGVDLMISILYMLSEPVSDFVFNQMFAGFGAALLPLLVLLISEILVQKDISPVKLALILTLIVEIHLMTFILSMLFLVPCVLIGLYVADDKRNHLFKHLCKGSVLMLILSFNVWGAILEVFGSNRHHIIPTFPGTNLGNRPYSAILSTYPHTSLLQSPSIIGMGVMLLIIITVILWLINLKNVNYITNVFMLFGLFFIWISSGYFPWMFVKHHAYSVATLIQFPKRFLPLGLILIYLSAGYFLSKCLYHYSDIDVVKCVILIALICLIGWGWCHNYKVSLDYIHTYNSDQVINWHRFTTMKWQTKPSSGQLRNSLRNDRPGKFISMVTSPVPDYLPTNITYRRPGQYKTLNPQSRYQYVYGKNLHFRWTSLNRGREVITVPSRNKLVTTIPLVKYAHTQISLNGHQVDPQINKIGAMRLHLRHGINRVTLQYRPSLWFRAGMLISIICWLCLIALFIDIKIIW